MSHPLFTARPSYQVLNQQPLKTLREQAAAELKAGHFNVQTLWLHKLCYRKSEAPIDYLNYLICRRQLGYLPSARAQQQIACILGWPFWRKLCNGLRRHRQVQLHNLLTEATQTPAPKGPLSEFTHACLNQQQQWQQAWCERLKNANAVHIVGNSPLLLEKQEGEQIDQADVVIRFNHFKSRHTPTQSIGQRCSAWVIAPGYEGPQLNHELSPTDPIILAGPAMLYWQQRFSNILGGTTNDLANALSNIQQPVLHIPLSTWRQCVRQFAAPPSAGALAIQWIHSILSAQCASQQPYVKLYGFGYDKTSDSRYHAAKPDHRPVSRHNWAAEQQWVQQLPCA